MFRRALILAGIFLGFQLPLKAQLVNTGEKLVVETGALLFIEKDYHHVGGSILNMGKISLQGDWDNQDVSGVFDARSVGSVLLSGNNQKITGTAFTVFPNLILSGAGDKILQADTRVKGVLNLNDRNLSISDFSLSILNPQPDALLRSSGFISVGKQGKLIRATNSVSPYVFPLGAVTGSGTVYRPIIIEPTDSQINTFSAAFEYADPSQSGFDRLSKRPEVQAVFDKYFYLLDQPTGSSEVQIRFYQNKQEDSDFNGLVNWTGKRLWEHVSPLTLADGSYGDGLNHQISYSSTQTIKNQPFTLATILEDVDPFIFYNAFSPDGDGKNDTWTIKNIEFYPENDLTIFNRWGDVIFKSKGYSNNNAWDGSNLNPGTYFYVLNANVNGIKKTYKGFITMLRKN
ncbi:MAG TPA: gliding motility-associated C-terminal domain-containing protein [Daejeonella sp.]|nr:gliding motility-associated C-terminal domain-containing protein [Daejeonella sp.]